MKARRCSSPGSRRLAALRGGRLAGALAALALVASCSNASDQTQTPWPRQSSSIAQARAPVIRDLRGAPNTSDLVVSQPRLAAAPDPARLADLKARADRGEAAAEADLAPFYCAGVGLPRDTGECLRLNKLAAAQDNSKGEFQLALMYRTGVGGPRDLAESSRLLAIVAAKGSSVAQYLVALDYATGLGVTRNDAEAVRWLKLSADQSNMPAEIMLAEMYETGRGTAKNDAEAVRLYRLAALGGNAIAARKLILLSAANDGGAIGPSPGKTFAVPLRKMGGVLVVPAAIDRSVVANFIVDSGASDIAIPEQLAAEMRRLGTLTDEDLAGVGTYRIADGSTFQVRTFRIRSLRVGDIELTNVKASLIPGKGFPLLGQSFLQHFTSWSIDNERQVLLLKEAAP